MTERAARVANLLLRVGVLNPDDGDHQAVYQQLMSEPVLYDEVRERLAQVGYQVVQFFGHLGIRLTRDAELGEVSAPDRPALHAGHVRLLVYLWVQLVYRQIQETSRAAEVEPVPGRSQTLFGFEELEDDADEAPTIPFEEVRAEFEEQYSQSGFRGLLTTLRRTGFIKQSGRTGPISAGPALYVLVDPTRMEEFVVGLARRGAGPLAEEESE